MRWFGRRLAVCAAALGFGLALASPVNAADVADAVGTVTNVATFCMSAMIGLLTVGGAVLVLYDLRAKVREDRERRVMREEEQKRHAEQDREQRDRERSSEERAKQLEGGLNNFMVVTTAFMQQSTGLVRNMESLVNIFQYTSSQSEKALKTLMEEEQRRKDRVADLNQQAERFFHTYSIFDDGFLRELDRLTDRARGLELFVTGGEFTPEVYFAQALATGYIELDPSQATTILEQRVLAAPNASKDTLARAQDCLGRMCLWLRQPSRAITCFAQARGLNPSNSLYELAELEATVLAARTDGTQAGPDLVTRLQALHERLQKQPESYVGRMKPSEFRSEVAYWYASVLAHDSSNEEATLARAEEVLGNAAGLARSAAIASLAVAINYKQARRGIRPLQVHLLDRCIAASRIEIDECEDDLSKISSLVRLVRSLGRRAALLEQTDPARSRQDFADTAEFRDRTLHLIRRVRRRVPSGVAIYSALSRRFEFVDTIESQVQALRDDEFRREVSEVPPADRSEVA